MYGMIHGGIRAMTIEQLGAAAWEKVLADTQFGPGEFISASTYDDEKTLEIVRASAAVFGKEVPDFLESFGEFWIRFAASGAYSSLMTMAGSDLVTFLNNLDRMHQSVQAAMADARLPLFTVQQADVTEIMVRYSSERAGLESFVIGLLQGLLKHFDQKGSVQQIAVQSDGVLFQIRLAG